ncbi:hypothetical protein DV736_g3971, partial [Chaetothyriales sp. CBS 134916]
MQHFDTHEVSTSLPARLTYLQAFLQFDPKSDGELIHATKHVLSPLVGTIVEAVYDHLLKYDITASAFAPAQAEGQTDADISSLGQDHENIKYRKDFLKGYLVKLAMNQDWTPESKFWEYIDNVGKAHTGAASGLKTRQGRPTLFVDYRDVGLLLGWVENAVVDIVIGVEGLDIETKMKIIKALNKYWWIQNDLFARHYVGEKVEQNGNPI